MIRRKPKRPPALWKQIADAATPPTQAKRRHIRAVTSKLGRARNIYRRMLPDFLAGKRCAVFGNLVADQVHHIRGRLGPLLIDKRFWLAVSHKGHLWIDANRDAARRKGWLAWPGEWKRIPDDQETARLREILA